MELSTGRDGCVVEKRLTAPDMTWAIHGLSVLMID
jgi:hypothetical protein